MDKEVSLIEASFIERTIRRFSQPILARLEPTIRWKVLDFLRGFKCRGVRENIKIKNPNRIVWPEGVEGAVCICHDIDYAMDYGFLEKIVSIENDYGMYSTINFLVNGDYKVEKNFLLKLVMDGFEVGLHGYTHDIGFGYHSKKKIRRDLKRALSMIPVEVKGYRAPALSISKRLLEVLEEIGIKYDSSISISSRYTKGVDTCSPYRYPGLNIWEVPLTLQDSTLFIDFCLNEKRGFQVIKGILEEVIGLGGVAVINFHPSILRRKIGFYRNLLKYLKNRKGIEITRIDKLIDYLEENNYV